MRRDIPPPPDFQEFPMRKIFVLVAAAAALTTAACNTVSGVGRDASAAGNAVTTAAEDAKN
jgi:entericidin B